LSGISTTVVTPPAAAAAEPVAHPSQSLRWPGSLKWTCGSTPPRERQQPTHVELRPACGHGQTGADHSDLPTLDEDVDRLTVGETGLADEPAAHGAQ
jgi:hypothetical protein